MSKAPIFPNCSIIFDVFELHAKTAHLSCGEMGKIIRSMFDNATMGNFEYLRQFPFIIGYKKGWKKRKPISSITKKRVLSIGKCAYCGSTKNLTIDHIIPICRGGSDDIKNLQCLCRDCNRKKGPERNG